MSCRTSSASVRATQLVAQFCANDPPNGSNNSTDNETTTRGDLKQPVCLILGAGSGVGGALAKKFAKEGFVACCVRRSNGEELSALVKEIVEVGGKAEGFVVDMTIGKNVVALVEDIETRLGSIEVLCYNIGANMGLHDIHDTKIKTVELAFRLGALGAFVAAQAVSKRQVARGRGTIFFTGSTASLRGNRGHSAHAMAMAARRMLAQSISHELAPKGIHVVHVILDGLVDSPGTVGLMFPEKFQNAKQVLEPLDGIVKPNAVADTYWHLYSQPRHSWTYEMDIRPYRDVAWYNT